MGAKISERKFKKYVPVFDEETVDRDLLVEGARNLRDYFQNPRATSRRRWISRRRRPAPDREEIIYVVTPATRHKLVEVTVQGNHYFNTEDIRERMFLQPAGFLRLRHGRYSDGLRAARRGSHHQTLYRSNGFRDVKVSTQHHRRLPGQARARWRWWSPSRRARSTSFPTSKSTVSKTLDLQRASPPCWPRTDRASPSAKPTWRWTATTSSGSTSRPAIRTWCSTGAWRPAPGRTRSSVHYVINEGERRFVRDVLITGMQHHARRAWWTPTSCCIPATALLDGDGPHAAAPLRPGRLRQGRYGHPEPEGDTTEQVRAVPPGGRATGTRGVAGFGAEVARIGGSQDSLDSPAGATGFSPRVSLDVSRLNLWGLGHSLNFKSRYSSAGPPRAAELLRAALPQRGRPQHLGHRALRQYARRAHVHGAAAGGLGADFAAVLQGHTGLSAATPTGIRGWTRTRSRSTRCWSRWWRSRRGSACFRAS